jgi:GAF domain-containing protein/HAMP domain-containing protein
MAALEEIFMRLKLSLGQRIGLIFVLLSLLIALTAVLGLQFTERLRRTMDTMVGSVDQVQQTTTLEETWAGMARALDVSLETRQALAPTLFEDDIAAFEQQLAGMSELQDPANPALAARHNAELGTLRTTGTALATTTRLLVETMSAGSWQSALALRDDELTPREAGFDEALDSFRRSVRQETELAIAASRQAETRIRRFWLGAAILLLANAGVIGFAVTRSTLAPIRNLIEQTNRVISRDFSSFTPLARQDEVGELSRAFHQMNEWLRDSYNHLQEQVTEQTENLALAAEIGRAVSRVRDVDELLADAVELLRTRFHLYFAQVYLTDESGLSLLLHAATGLIGEEMVRLGHHLSIGPGSVAGLAAFGREPVVVNDADQSEIFRPNPLLPHTRSELAVPLLVGERVIGVLDLQSSEVNGLNATHLPAFTAVAGQLAIAIHNAHLFGEAESARRELAAQARQLTRDGWETYLDAIERREKLVYSFDGRRTNSAAESSVGPAADGALSVPIAISGEPYGRLLVEARVTGEAEVLVQAVADQVARRIESLRLLTQANKYRSEAEEANRRLTQRAWEDYRAEHPALARGYEYDQDAVIELTDEAVPDADAITAPLKVRDAVVGVLEVTQVPLATAPLARDLLSGVADQLSNHIENLRLAQQTEKALAESRQRNQELTVVNQVVAAANASLDLRRNLNTMVRHLHAALPVRRAAIALVNEEGDALTILAEASAAPGTEERVGTVIPLAGNDTLQEVMRSRARLASPVKAGQEGGEGTATLALFPVIVAGDVIGALELIVSEEEQALSPDQERLIDTILLQAATAIQQSRLFDQLQATLAQTEALYAGSSRVIQARNMEEALAAVVESTALHDMDWVEFLSFETPWESAAPEMMTALASWSRPDSTVNRATAGASYRTARLTSLRQLRGGRPLFVADMTSPDRHADLRPLLIDQKRIRGLALFPVSVRGQWIGLLSAQSARRLRLDEAAIRQTTNLVGQAATVIESLRLFEKTEAALAETATLFHISVALNSATSLQEMLAMAGSPSIMPGVEHVELLSVSTDDGGTPRAVSSIDAWRAEAARSKPAFARGAWTPAENLPDIERLRQDRYSILMIGDVVDEPGLDAGQRRRLLNANIAAIALLPLRQGQRWLGLLAVSWSEPQKFSPREQRLFTGFATQAAVTLANLQLLSQSQAQARRERVLREVTERVRNASDVDAVMRIATEEIGHALGRATVLVLGNGYGIGADSAPPSAEERPHG